MRKKKDKKNVKVNEVSEPKKKSGFKKNKKPLFVKMNFNESVPEMLWDILRNSNQLFNTENESIVLLVTDNMFSQFSPKDEVFGSFSKDVRDNEISAIVIPSEIKENRLYIIPDKRTLDRMGEYSFLNEADFNLAIVAKDESGSLVPVITEQTMKYEDILEAVNNNVQYTIDENTHKIIPLKEIKKDIVKKIPENTAVPEEKVVVRDSEEVETVEDKVEANEPTGEEIVQEVEPEEVVVEEETTDDSSDIDLDIFSEDDVMNEDIEEFVINDESIRDILNRKFLDDNLGLKVNIEDFNAYFDSQDIVPIIDSIEGDSELDKVARQMSNNATAELKKIHAQNIAQLKATYQTAMANEIANIEKRMDIDSLDTKYGKRIERLRDDNQTSRQNQDKKIEARSESLRKEYEDKKAMFVNKAKTDAEMDYDNKNKSMLEKEISGLADEYELKLEEAFRKEKFKILAERQDEAKKIYDQSNTRILNSILKAYGDILRSENSLSKAKNEEIRKYVRDYYSSEIMKAEALRDKLDRDKRISKLKEDYEQFRKFSDDRLRERDNAHDEALRRIEEKYKKNIEDIKEEYKETLDKKEVEKKELNDNIKYLQDSLVAQDEKKASEFKHRLNMMQDELDAKNRQIDAKDKDLRRQEKFSLFIMIAILIIGVACGIVFALSFLAKGGYTMDSVSSLTSSDTDLAGVIDVFKTLV